MSHKWDCPTDYEAEREGRRDGDWGRSRYSNPYAEGGDQPCEEAARNWEYGFRRGERAREEREQEERDEAARAQRRREQAEQEEFYCDYDGKDGE